jgi:hypothetical protein
VTRITVMVDDVSYVDDVEPRTLLVHYLRERLGKTGIVVGCDTKVDTETGRVQIRRYVCVDDVGTVVNPHRRGAGARGSGSRHRAGNVRGGRVRRERHAG